MAFLKNPRIIFAILAIAAAVAGLTATQVDDSIVAGLREWYESTQTEVLAPDAVAPVAN